MSFERLPYSRLGLAALLLGCAVSSVTAQESPAVTYDQVRAVLKKRCLTCHDADRARGDLDLSSVASIKAGSASGPVVVAGKADESLIYTLAAHLEDPKMPPGTAKIPQRELDLIRGWIDGGLQERGGATPQPSAAVATTADPAKPAMKSPAAESRGAEVRALSGPTTVTALAASPRGDLVAISGRRQIILLQASDAKPVRTLEFPEGDVFVLKFTADGQRLVAAGGVGAESGRVVGFEVDSGRRVFEAGDETDVILAADLSPDGRHVAVGGPWKSVKVYPVAGGEPIATLRKHTDWILSVAFSPDGLLLATSDRFGGLQVWEAATGKEFFTLRGHTGAVTSVNWLGGSDRLLSAGEDGTLRIWDMHKGQPERQWDAGVGAILSATVGAKGEIAAAGRGRKLALWSSLEASPRRIAMNDEVAEVAWTGDASRVIAADAAGQVEFYTSASGESAARFVIPIEKVAREKKPRPAPVAMAKPAAAPVKVAVTTAPTTEPTAAATEVARLQKELSAAREALALLEEAVAPAEESLKKLRESSARLKIVVSGHEQSLAAAIRRAEEEQARLAQAGPARSGQRASASVGGEASIDEKRLLLESASAFAQQIEDAAARAPSDEGLQAALKLARELKTRLAADVDSADRGSNSDPSQRDADVAGN